MQTHKIKNANMAPNTQNTSITISMLFSQIGL